jgi:hypothetical protein
MNNKVTNFIMFAAGAALGSVTTWKLLKTKYERLAQEEIDSVKEVFSRKETKPKDEVETKTDIPKETPANKPAIASYAEMNRTLGYTDYSAMSNEDEEPTPSVAPYVVSPDEFGFAEGYDIINLTYYADGVLADDTDDIIDDIEGTIGEAALRRFGEFEPDAVHVRNDVRKAEYEILRVRETYEEATGRSRPDQMEEE